MKTLDKYHIHPAPDRVLVRVCTPEKTQSLIQLAGKPPHAYDQFAVVVALGASALDKYPSTTPDVGRPAVGKIVGFSRHTVGMSLMEVNGEKLFPLKPEEISVILTELPQPTEEVPHQQV